MSDKGGCFLNYFKHIITGVHKSAPQWIAQLLVLIGIEQSSCDSCSVTSGDQFKCVLCVVLALFSEQCSLLSLPTNLTANSRVCVRRFDAVLLLAYISSQSLRQCQWPCTCPVSEVISLVHWPDGDACCAWVHYSIDQPDKQISLFLPSRPTLPIHVTSTWQAPLECLKTNCLVDRCDTMWDNSERWFEFKML